MSTFEYKIDLSCVCMMRTPCYTNHMSLVCMGSQMVVKIASLKRQSDIFAHGNTFGLMINYFKYLLILMITGIEQKEILYYFQPHS